MGIADKIKGAVQGVAAEGTERAQALADSRKRGKLITELGEMTYRRAKGEAIDDTLVEAVIASIDHIDTESSSTDEAGNDDGSEDIAEHVAEEISGTGGDNGDAEKP